MVYGLAIIEEIAKLLPNFNIDQDQLRKADRTTVDSKIIEIIQALNEMSQAHEKEKSRLKEELESLKGEEQLLKEQVERLEGELKQDRERLQTSEEQDKELYSKTHQLAIRSLGQIGQEPPKDAPTDHQILANLSERVVSLLETHISALKKDSEGKTSEVTRLQKEIEALKTSEAPVEPKGFKLEAVIKLATVCKRICSPGEAAETSPAEDLELLALATESAVNRLIEELRSQKEVADNHQTQLRESAERVDGLQKRVEDQDKLLSDHKTGMETLLSEVQSLCGMADFEVDFKPVAQEALNKPGVLAPLVKSVCETVLQLKTSNSKEKEQVEQRLSSSDDQSPNSNAQQLKELMQLIELHSKRIEGDEHFSGSHQDRLNNLIGSLEKRYQEYLKSTLEKINSSSVFFCRGLIGVVEWVEHEELRYRLSNFLEDLLSSIVKNRSTERRHIVSLSEADQNSSTKSTHWSNIEQAFFAQANELGS
jgi:hypothetical protein